MFCSTSAPALWVTGLQSRLFFCAPHTAVAQQLPPQLSSPLHAHQQVLPAHSVLLRLPPLVPTLLLDRTEAMPSSKPMPLCRHVVALCCAADCRHGSASCTQLRALLDTCHRRHNLAATNRSSTARHLRGFWNVFCIIALTFESRLQPPALCQLLLSRQLSFRASRRVLLHRPTLPSPDTAPKPFVLHLRFYLGALYNYEYSS